MQFGSLYVRLSEEEGRLAKDIFSGEVKRMILPYYFPFDDVREFLLIVEGAKPGAAVVKVSDLYYASLGCLLKNAVADRLVGYEAMLAKEFEEDHDVARMFTIIEISEVTVIPMDFAEVQNSRYLQGSLREEGDTENSRDILGKLTGP